MKKMKRLVLILTKRKFCNVVKIFKKIMKREKIKLNPLHLCLNLGNLLGEGLYQILP